jgi:hypothetical protein
MRQRVYPDVFWRNLVHFHWASPPLSSLPSCLVHCGFVAFPDSAVLGEKWRTPGPTDLIIPKWQRELFKTILDEENLRFDREGRPRTAYSLRHTYICLRLMEGADIYQIAKNCRTSVEMIEKYYAAHIKTSLDAAAINVMRSKKFKKRKPKGGGLKTPTQA